MSLISYDTAAESRGFIVACCVVVSATGLIGTRGINMPLAGS